MPSSPLADYINDVRGDLIGRLEAKKPRLYKPGDVLVAENGNKWTIIKPYVPPKNRQCYFLSKDLLEAISLEEMVKTVMAMEEFGIYRLPYPEVDIKFKADELLKFVSSEGEELEDKRFGSNCYCIMVGVGSANPLLLLDMNGQFWADLSGYMERHCVNGHDRVKFYQDLLIVTLAMKQVRKETVRNPMAALRIGKSKASHVYTTTLRLPAQWDQRGEAGPTGSRRGPRPHLRAGHIRRQHYGPKNEAVKMVWVEATFVNADGDFVSQRRAYNVSREEGGEGDGQRKSQGQHD
jgi:hypothetical protein